MLLHALNDLYGRLEQDGQTAIAPPGYSTQKVSFIVVLARDGSLFGVKDAKLPGQRGSRPRQIIAPGGAKPTGGVTKASVARKVLLLRNDAPFLLGVETPEEGTEPLTLSQKGEFEAFREFHLSVEAEIQDKHFSIVCRYLEGWTPEKALKHPDWRELLNGQGVFQILGEEGFVHERPRVRAWWDRKQVSADARWTGQCLITGRVGPLAELHEPKLKGIPGANTSGAPIVSFNADAFESYGLHSGQNAPVGARAAFRYATALNALLDEPSLKAKHRVQLGSDVVVFWTDRPSRTEDVFAAFCSGWDAREEKQPAEDESTRQKLELFLRALREGRPAYAELEDDPERTRFFLLALGGNSGRVAVRYFHEDTVAELLDCLRLHEQHCEIAGGRTGNGSGSIAPPIWRLLDQTCPRRSGKPDRDKIPPLLSASLLQAVLSGGRYPLALYQAVLRRLPVDGVDHPRASILKAILIRNFGKEVSMSLDRENEQPAYRLGRLFAALEKTQLDALGSGLNRTVRDSYYGSASTAPATVFPRILRTYQHHLSKLEGGRKVNRDRAVQEILGPIRRFPTHLSLVEQGEFALGYYHQMTDFYTPRNEGRPGSEGGEE